jgi:hypothetical protein
MQDHPTNWRPHYPEFHSNQGVTQPTYQLTHTPFYPPHTFPGFSESFSRATEHANQMAQHANHMAQHANRMAQHADQMAQYANQTAQHANTLRLEVAVPSASQSSVPLSDASSQQLQVHWRGARRDRHRHRHRHRNRKQAQPPHRMQDRGAVSQQTQNRGAVPLQKQNDGTLRPQASKVAKVSKGTFSQKPSLRLPKPMRGKQLNASSGNMREFQDVEMKGDTSMSVEIHGNVNITFGGGVADTRGTGGSHRAYQAEVNADYRPVHYKNHLLLAMRSGRI